MRAHASWSRLEFHVSRCACLSSPTRPHLGRQSPEMALVRIALTLLLLTLCCHSAHAINCYQCDSNVDLECSEDFDHDVNSLRATSCDHIHEARFCIKTTGMYGGPIGTVRNCSSRDWGDYCAYLERSGDIRHTRSCIYTCSSDGCNGVATAGVPAAYWAALTLVLTSAQSHWLIRH